MMNDAFYGLLLACSSTFRCKILAETLNERCLTTTYIPDVLLSALNAKLGSLLVQRECWIEITGCGQPGSSGNHLTQAQRPS
jgi:hypothetical protein